MVAFLVDVGGQVRAPLPIDRPWPSEPVDALDARHPFHVGVSLERGCPACAGHDLVVRENAGLWPGGMA